MKSREYPHKCIIIIEINETKAIYYSLQSLENGKRKRGRPRKSWMSDTLSEHLQNIDIAWDEFAEVADDPVTVAQCVPARGAD